MILDPNKYTHCINTLKTMRSNSPDKELGLFVSEVAVATGVPCYAICVIYGRLYNESEELELIKSSLQKFYKYDTIEELGDIE